MSSCSTHLKEESPITCCSPPDAPWYLGIDIAKDFLQLVWLHQPELPPSYQTLPNNCPEGIQCVLEFCQQRACDRVILEASAGYEQRLVTTLALTNLPVVVITPQIGAHLCPGHRATGQN